MFECTLKEGELFRKIVVALTELLQEGNFMIDGNQISFQGMDSSHVSLVALSLRSSGFESYRCDRDLTLGINFASLSKVLKCMAATDKLSLRAEDNADSCFLMFEGTQKNERLSTFELRLMEIDSEQLGIPQTEYQTSVRMPASEFQRICRDLSAIGDSVVISVDKEGVKFSVNGDIGGGEMVLRGNMVKGGKANNKNSNVKKESDENKDVAADDDDENMGGGNNNNFNSNSNAANVDDVDDEDEDDDDDSGENVFIRMDEPVSLTFALRYLNSFTKSTSLSKYVTLSMGTDVPLVCQYTIGGDLGDIRYYLAPKIDEEA